MDLNDYDHMPTVAAVMTPFPYCVSPDDPLSRARELMAEHDFHHVPVRRGSEVVGLVSETDLAWLRNPKLGPAEGEELSVGDLKLEVPYLVDVGNSLSAAALEMAERRVSAAVVLKHDRLAGILTVTDVCQAFGSLLAARFGSSTGDDDAA